MSASADTPFGPLVLGLPNEGADLDAVGLALAMAACEPLLQALEDWLGVPLDPAPSPPPRGTGLDCVMRSAALAPPGTTCRLPWAAVVDRGLPPALQAPAVRWPKLPCNVEISAYDDASLGHAILAPGCLMLLPASFGECWIVQATEPGSGRRIAFEWRADEGLLHRSGAVAAGTPPGWRVVNEDTVPLPAEVVFGLPADEALPAPPGRARLVDASGHVRASGCLVPALRGWALAIDAPAAGRQTPGPAA